MALLEFTDDGIFCPKAKVYIDPWRPVDRAIITHAHADHSRWGMKHYLAHTLSTPIMKHRLGSDISVESKAYGEPFHINGVRFSLHPAGHIIGSAQVRVEYKGEVWVVSGDYKVQEDATCLPFEPVKCHAFISESTFGLPVFRWPNPQEVFSAINEWWHSCNAKKVTPIILCYALGKAQRIIQALDAKLGSIYTHGAIENSNLVLREAGVALQNTIRITPETDVKELKQGGIIIAPPSAHNSPWMRKFKPYEVGIASGWMALRGTRRRRNADRGFVLSDHADFHGLCQAISETEAEKIFITHGYTNLFTDYLNSIGYNAEVVSTEYEGELSEIGESDSEKELDNAA